MFTSYAIVDSPLCIVMQNGYIACGLFIKNRRQLLLMGYACAPLPLMFDMVSVLTGQEYITKFIESFAKNHALNSIVVSMAVSPPKVYEEFVFLSHATPDLLAFNFQKPVHLMWDYRYLFPIDDGQHCFYVSAISQQVVFQYKLLMIRNGWEVRLLTSYQATLLSLYEHMQQEYFRTIEFAQQMSIYDYDIVRLMRDACVENFIIIDQVHVDNWAQEKEYIMALAGLFIATERSI